MPSGDRAENKVVILYETKRTSVLLKSNEFKCKTTNHSTKIPQQTVRSASLVIHTLRYRPQDKWKPHSQDTAQSTRDTISKLTRTHVNSRSHSGSNMADAETGRQLAH